jgi:hypothetical protein
MSLDIADATQRVASSIKHRALTGSTAGILRS